MFKHIYNAMKRQRAVFQSNLELISHRKTSPKKIKESFANAGLYSQNFLNDLEEGLRKSSMY